jgi:hypothetical protein
VHVASGVRGTSDRSLSTTHPRLLTKVDSSSGSEVAAGQALAELLTREKDRCILVMAPARVGADELEMRAYEAKIGRLNPLTHVDGFDDPAGAKPTPSSNDAIEKTQQDRIVH